jgi:hypothetical protein
MTGGSRAGLVKEKAHFIEPMACLAVAHLPEGEAWEYELKFDGYRALGIKTGGIAQLKSAMAKISVSVLRRSAGPCSSSLMKPRLTGK